MIVYRWSVLQDTQGGLGTTRLRCHATRTATYATLQQTFLELGYSDTYWRNNTHQHILTLYWHSLEMAALRSGHSLGSFHLMILNDFDVAANFNPRFGSRALTLCISSQALQAMPAPISNEPMDPNGKGLKIHNQNIPKHTKTLAVELEPFQLLESQAIFQNEGS